MTVRTSTLAAGRGFLALPPPLSFFAAGAGRLRALEDFFVDVGEERAPADVGAAMDRNKGAPPDMTHLGKPRTFIRHMF